jgi:hypothetical protein
MTFDAWLDFDESPKDNMLKKAVDTKSYATVHYNDLEAVNVIQPNVTDGPWIAGGACLRWYQNVPVGDTDIDIFCANPKQAAEVIDRIKSYGRYTVKHESENATTLEYFPLDRSQGVDRWILQVIKKDFYTDLQSIIDRFDISVCQIGTAGDELVIGEYTARDVRERNLRMRMPLHQDAVKRLTKYWTYGFRPVPGLLDAIKDNPNAKWVFNPAEDYS